MHLDDIKAGLCAAVAIPVAPFTDDDQLDQSALAVVIDRMVTEGVTVMTPNGNTGEFYSLSPAECRSAVDVTTSAAGDRALTVAGIGFDVATAIDMGRSAQQAGAVGVMIHQPVHPYRSMDGWVPYHADIAAALPDLGVVLYVRDPQVSPGMISALLDRCPNVVGIKFAVADPVRFATVAREVGLERVAWICGIAEAWTPFFWLGGALGFTSGVVNVVPRLTLDMLNCLRADDFAGAMQVWAQLKPFEDLRARDGGRNSVSAIKEALAQLGLCGRAVRPPITDLPAAERSEVSAILSGWPVGMPVA